jgi:site-specific DNA recombinase
MPTAYVYARYSSENQRQESIDAQLQAIRAYAAKEGITITREFIDREESATSDRRTEFQLLFEAVKHNPPDFVLVHKFDRFARNRYDAAIYRKKLKDAGTRLISVLEKMDDSPESIILMSVLEGMAEYYSVNLAREVMKGLLQNAHKGRWNGGKPPLGYKLDSGRRVIVDDTAAASVRKVFDLFLSGNGYTYIAQEMNASGFKSPGGTIWRKGTVRDTLTNERYTGTFIYNQRTSKGPDGKRNNHHMKPDSEVIRIPDAYPGIVSRKDWEDVQQMLERRVKGPRPGTTQRQYLLTGLVWCGECKSPYVGAGYRKKGKYPIYGCTHAGTGTCGNSTINADFLEDFSLEMLRTQVFSNEAISMIVPVIVEAARSRIGNTETELKTIRARIKEEEAKMEKLLDMVEAGLGSHDDLKRRLVDRGAALDLLRHQEGTVQKRNMTAISEKQVRAYLEVCREKLESVDFLDKRKIAEAFIERIDVFRDRCHIDFYVDQVADMVGGTKVKHTITATLTRRYYFGTTG